MSKDDGITVQGVWHEPYIKGFCVGCHQFDQFLSQVKPNVWRCDPCRDRPSNPKEAQPYAV